jgi:ABC-2 type transport system permease protein
VKEIFRAAMVIARRDFTAIIYSKAFIFFLLGPFFPVLVGIAAGNLGGQIAREAAQPVVGLAMEQSDSQKILNAREKLAVNMGENYFTQMKLVGDPARDQSKNPQDYLKKKEDNLSVVVTGSLAEPVVTGTKRAVDRESPGIEMLAAYAMNPSAMKLPEAKADFVAETANNDKQLRTVTAQGGQILVFFLTMLLAGMVLSNLVEEKSNKIIEILAASIPMESVFLGKLFAMLGMALLGIFVWTAVGVIGLQFARGIPNFPTPAVGWPMFITLCFTYFIMAYLMLGALFLGIGAMAATVREVQTISMPVTMAQLINFFFASYALTKTGQPVEQFAAIFPFSSPFAMIGRAALEPNLWHHAVAIVGQILFAILLLRLGVVLFKRNVMKSGNAGRIKDAGKRKLFGLITVRG